MRWLVGIVAVVIQPFRYVSRRRHPASSDVTAENRSEGVVEGAQAVVTATKDVVCETDDSKVLYFPGYC